MKTVNALVGAGSLTILALAALAGCAGTPDETPAAEESSSAVEMMSVDVGGRTVDVRLIDVPAVARPVAAELVKSRVAAIPEKVSDDLHGSVKPQSLWNGCHLTPDLCGEVCCTGWWTITCSGGACKGDQATSCGGEVCK